MLSQKIKVVSSIFLSLIVVFSGYLLVNSGDQTPEIETSTTGFYKVTNKNKLENQYWIDVNNASNIPIKITVNDITTWNEIEVGKNYTIHFRRVDNKDVLQSIYPELYNGRIE